MPLPLPPEVTVSQLALLVAVQPQPLAAVTVNVPEAPAALTFADAGESVGAQGPLACVTVNVFPPMVIEPVRAALEAFAVTEYDTVPLAVPDAPWVTVIQPSLLTAVQLQPLAAVTVTAPLEAPPRRSADVGEIVALHGAPACITVKVLPAIVSVPVRGVVAVFAATSKVTEPLPFPVAPVARVIHPALLVAVHAQPVAAVTETEVPVVAAAAMFAVPDEIVGAHGAPACVTLNVLPPIVSVAVRAVVVGFAVKV